MTNSSSVFVSASCCIKKKKKKKKAVSKGQICGVEDAEQLDTAVAPSSARQNDTGGFTCDDNNPRRWGGRGWLGGVSGPGLPRFHSPPSCFAEETGTVSKVVILSRKIEILISPPAEQQQAPHNNTKTSVNGRKVPHKAGPNTSRGPAGRGDMEPEALGTKARQDHRGNMSQHSHLHQGPLGRRARCFPLEPFKAELCVINSHYVQ